DGGGGWGGWGGTGGPTTGPPGPAPGGSRAGATGVGPRAGVTRGGRELAGPRPPAAIPVPAGSRRPGAAPLPSDPGPMPVSSRRASSNRPARARWITAATALAVSTLTAPPGRSAAAIAAIAAGGESTYSSTLC